MAKTAAKTWLVHGLLSAATFGAFVSGLGTPLQPHWDDGRFIIDNPMVRNPSVDGLLEILGGIQFQAYHPLHLLSYWLDVPFTGANPLAIHAVSLLLWLIAANLLLRAFMALGLSSLSAGVGALACVVHPVQVEAVVWATGRKDVLALLFAAAALWAHARAERPGDRSSWLAHGCYGLGLLSKTTVLPLPLLFVAADVFLRGASPRVAMRRQIPAFVLAALCGVLVLSTWEANEMIRANAGGWLQAPVRAVSTLGHQTLTALWPATVSPMYATDAVADLSGRDLMVVVGLLGATALALRGSLGAAAFALVGYLVLMLPVMNLVPMYFPWQDRYLSLPLLPLGFGLGAALDAVRPSGKTHPPIPALVGAVLLLGALGARTVQYSAVWQSEARLWGHAAAVHGAPYAWLQLGHIHRDAGNLERAIDSYKRFTWVAPQRRVGQAALLQASVLADERALGLSPSKAEAYAEQYYKSLDRPDDLRALSHTMLTSGHHKALELPLDRALRLEPADDERLERAAIKHLLEGRPSIALFYLRHMRKPTERPALKAVLEAAAGR